MTIPIDLAHRPYNSVRTNVLHCDVCSLHVVKVQQTRERITWSGLRVSQYCLVLIPSHRTMRLNVDV